MHYSVALGVFDGRLGPVEIGTCVVEDNREDEEIVIGGPGPGSPVRQVAIDKKQYPQQTSEVELIPLNFPFLRQVIFTILSKNATDFVLVKPIVKFLLLRHAE